MYQPAYSFSYAIPYIAVFLVLCVFCVPLYTTNKKCGYVSVQIYGALVLLSFFIAFRGYIYADWINYIIKYDTAPTLFSGFDKIKYYLTKLTWGEPGYGAYLIICKTISSDYIFLQIISSLVDIAILFYFFRVHIENNIIMGFVFFFVFSLLLELDALRNVKAIMFFLISIRYIHEKKIMRYMALNFFGMLFHASAIIYLPLYFILNIRFNKTLVFWLWVFGNVVFLTQFNWMREILYNVIDHSFGRYSFLLKRYQDVGEQGISIGYIERSLSFVLLFLFQNKLEKKGNVSNVFINVMYIYIFIHLYFFEMDVIVKRFSLLFLCGYWIIYPEIYRIISKPKKGIFLFLMILYGILRLGYNNALVERRYENVLLPHQSRQQSEKIYR